jgi:hypothetical protein
MVKWGKIHTILAIAVILIGGYFAVPKIVWLIQPQKINQVCPSTLINETMAGVQLKNIGLVPVTSAVNFEGENISFVDDFGNVNTNFSVTYVIVPNNPTPYNFIPIFSFTPYNSNDVKSIRISNFCSGFCFSESDICCYYKTSASNSISLINETNCE